MPSTSQRTRKYLSKRKFANRVTALYNKIYVTEEIKFPHYNFSEFLIKNYFPELK